MQCNTMVTIMHAVAVAVADTGLVDVTIAGAGAVAVAVAVAGAGKVAVRFDETGNSAGAGAVDLVFIRRAPRLQC